MKQTAKQVDVVIMAGGTGGHIFPGLAVAEKLRAQGYSVAWLGAHGLETTLVPKHNIELYSLSIKGLRGNGLKGWLMLPFKMLKAVREAKAILKMLSPKCVIGFGGFASGPGGLAANALKIPLMIHEQNAVPGMTNRYLAKMSQHVMTGFPLPQWANSQYVGNPVREALFQLPNIQTRFAGHDANELRVLVVGGSQGSRFLNTIVPTVMAGSKRNIAVWHQTGQKLFDEANVSWATTGVTPFRIAPFIEDMGEAYAWADIIICRAGALTLAELTAVGLGSILIPLPTAVDDHQRKNAAFLVQSDAAYCIDEKTFDAQQMITILDGITLERAQEMAENAHKNAKPKAVEEIAEAIERTF